MVRRARGGGRREAGAGARGGGAAPAEAGEWGARQVSGCGVGVLAVSPGQGQPQVATWVTLGHRTGPTPALLGGLGAGTVSCLCVSQDLSHWGLRQAECGDRTGVMSLLWSGTG